MKVGLLKEERAIGTAGRVRLRTRQGQTERSYVIPAQAGIHLRPGTPPLAVGRDQAIPPETGGPLGVRATVPHVILSGVEG